MSEKAIIIKEIDLDASIVSLRNDGIIQILTKPDRTLNLNDGMQMVEAFAEIGGGKKFPLLFIAGNFTLASTDARKYAATEDANKYTLATVFVVSNIAQKLMANAYIAFNHPITPTRALTNMDESITWLKTFL